jgi:hypothetical protein
MTCTERRKELYQLAATPGGMDQLRSLAHKARPAGGGKPDAVGGKVDEMIETILKASLGEAYTPP